MFQINCENQQDKSATKTEITHIRKAFVLPNRGTNNYHKVFRILIIERSLSLL